MTYDYTNAPDKYLRDIEFLAIPEAVPSQHAEQSGVISRQRMILPDDDIELYVEERRSDWRVLLPNGKIKLCSSRATLQGFLEGIAAARTMAHDVPK